MNDYDFLSRPYQCKKCKVKYYRKNVLKAHVVKCMGIEADFSDDDKSVNDMIDETRTMNTQQAVAVTSLEVENSQSSNP